MQLGLIYITSGPAWEISYISTRIPTWGHMGMLAVMPPADISTSTLAPHFEAAELVHLLDLAPEALGQLAAAQFQLVRAHSVTNGKILRHLMGCKW